MPPVNAATCISTDAADKKSLIAMLRQACVTQVSHMSGAAIAQLGERQTEDLKVPGSIPGLGIFNSLSCLS